MSFESRTAGPARVSPPHPERQAVSRTSQIAGLVEVAAARLLSTRLRDGESSVAIQTDLTHLVPTSSSAFRVTAKEQDAIGRLHRFTVHVFDETGLIASATHTRAIVDRRRLLGMARRRAGLPSMQLRV